MTWLHRGTIFAYAFMAASSAWSASLPTGHAWHIGACVLWVGLVWVAWHNGHTDARLREAARLSAMADGMAALRVAIASHQRSAPAAGMRRDAIAVLEGRATHPTQHPLHSDQPIPGQRETAS